MTTIDEICKNDNLTTSCGGVVIYRNKILLLYKNKNGTHVGWVLPKGKQEPGETKEETAIREVREESGSKADIVKYLGSTRYSFRSTRSDDTCEIGDILEKAVHWYLMSTNSYHSKPQAEEFFADSGFYKRHEAEYLLKFHDERQVMRKAFAEYDKASSNARVKNSKIT